MSIYATLWTLRFPKDGDHFWGCEWIAVRAHGVPAHIGTPTPGEGHEDGDPFGDFLPPSVAVDENGDAHYMRAVVFVTEYTPKAADRSGQEFVDPLLVLTGEEYARITFDELYERICSALRGDSAPAVAAILKPYGSTSIVHGQREVPGGSAGER
ncbi:MAG: hypothetical protein HYU66_28790 [Armatimonadetes bacterium]|nr:hypothetical protein [Armatimonadota bacterium]